MDQTSTRSADVMAYRPPAITSASVTTVPTVDTTVSIFGTDFGPDASQVLVLVNGFAVAAVNMPVRHFAAYVNV